MVLPEGMRMIRGVYRRRRLAVPTLVVFGRRDRPYTEELMERICSDPERYADRVEFAYVDDAAHFHHRRRLRGGQRDVYGQTAQRDERGNHQYALKRRRDDRRQRRARV